MNITGNGKKGILVIAEPNSSNDVQRALFLKSIDLLVDCYCISLPILRGKEKKEWKIELDKKILELKPNHILLFGEKVLKIFYAGMPKLGIATYRGSIIPDNQFNSFVCPLMDPIEVSCAFNRNLSSVANHDLQRVINHLNTEFTFYNPEKYIRTITDFDEVIAELRAILGNKTLVAYDYETTGLKPFHLGHKIVSIGIAIGMDNAFSFPFEYIHWTKEQFNKIRKLWIKILEDKNIYKVAHNAGFEEMWDRVILKAESNAIWDTMVTAHILDSRPGIAGLKHQAFINFGIKEYNKEAKKYIETVPGTPFNRMMEMPFETLCKYNSMDALITYWLYRKQRKEVAIRDLGKANSFFVGGIEACLDAQLNGVRIDMDYFRKIEKKLVEELVVVEEKINTHKEVKEFELINGYEINFGSSKDLRILFYDMLRLETTKLTKSKKASVDAESLEKIDHPLANLIVEKRQLLKLKDTYIGQFIRENDNGYMHPFFHLHTASSFRSSSSSPNLQNIPIHDEKAKKLIRGGIYPHPGHHLVEIDYSSAEVKTAACVTKDPVLLKYVLDESTDMHRDQAEEIWLCSEEDIKSNKPLRQAAKNEFVFPQIYKAWFGTCAQLLWISAQKLKFNDELLIDHLKAKGTSNFVQFKAHIKKTSEKFWERFPILAIWQNQMIIEYQNHGFITTVDGFQCSSVLTDNMACNYPIQGPSFHCLLWSMIKLNKELKRLKLKSKIMGQVHDSLLLSVPPEELRIVLPLARKIMTDDMKKDNSWVTVSFSADLEIALIDRPWSEKKSEKWEDYE